MDSKFANPEINTPILSHSLLAPLSIQTEHKTDIPSVNIIPSSPIPARHPISYSPVSDKVNKTDPEPNEELELINTLEQYIQKKRSATNELNAAIGEVSKQSKDVIKEPQSNILEPGPVIMKIEHIDDNKINALNIKATEKFPVVTRRFRQLPNQISKETLDEDASKQAQNLPSAQLNVPPVHDLKCETCENNEKPDTSAGEAPEESTVNANAVDHP